MANEGMEETLIRWLHRIAKGQQSFPVLLNNYSGFPSHTIFIRVQDPAPFKQLAARLKVIGPHIREFSSWPVKFISFPHVTIAGRLPLKMYDEAIRDYAGKDFSGSFNATEMTLIRREQDVNPCREVAVFHLQPGDFQ